MSFLFPSSIFSLVCLCLLFVPVYYLSQTSPLYSPTSFLYFKSQNKLHDEEHVGNIIDNKVILLILPVQLVNISATITGMSQFA